MIAFPSSAPSPRPILRRRRTRSNLRSAPSAITPVSLFPATPFAAASACREARRTARTSENKREQARGMLRAIPEFRSFPSTPVYVYVYLLPPTHPPPPPAVLLLPVNELSGFHPEGTTPQGETGRRLAPGDFLLSSPTLFPPLVSFTLLAVSARVRVDTRPTIFIASQGHQLASGYAA